MCEKISWGMQDPHCPKYLSPWTSSFKVSCICFKWLTLAWSWNLTAVQQTTLPMVNHFSILQHLLQFRSQKTIFASKYIRNPYCWDRTNCKKKRKFQLVREHLMLNALKLTEGETSENIREWFWANELSDRHGRGKRVITENVKKKTNFFNNKIWINFSWTIFFRDMPFLKQVIFFFNPEFNSCFFFF